MRTFIILKTLEENEATRIYCEEVVGIYAGAIKAESSKLDDVRKAAEVWVDEYCKRLMGEDFDDADADPIDFEETECDDENVVLCYEILQCFNDNDNAELIETLYFYPLKARL